MISNKNPIIRQKKIEMCANLAPTVSITTPNEQLFENVDSENSDNNSPQFDLDTEFHYLNLENSTSRCSVDSSQERASMTEPINIENTPNDKDYSNTEYKKIHTPTTDTKTLTSMLNNNGNKLHISNALRARLRRSKSPNPLNPKNPLLTNNSMPTNNSTSMSQNTQTEQSQKMSKFSNLSNRLSNQASSFFSRSCQGEELTNGLVSKAVKVNDTENVKNSIKTGNSSSHININSIKMKSFLAFTRIGLNKTPSPTKSFSKGPSVSLQTSVDENESLNSSNLSSPLYSKQNSLSSYDVDYEKLARELVLPSLNQPLTSFKNANQEESKTINNDNDNTRPVLQSCKTMDLSDSLPHRKSITRANTENSDFS